MAGGTFVTWDRWISSFEKVTGVEIRRINMPARALVGFGRVLDGLARVLPSFEPPLGREGAQFMSYMVPTDDAAFLAETGLGQYRDVDSSVRDFVEWLVDTDFIERP
ncbi:MAG: hypothetical protein HKN26_04815 [Acidimicrobiales bacterium]|nr:hypothetical protein [Acidimicrobiales bacterium]